MEVIRPMGGATDVQACPVCDGVAVRVFTPPMLPSAQRSAMALIDRAEKSRSEPEVVTSVPRRPPSERTPTAPRNPALQRLPRP